MIRLSIEITSPLSPDDRDLLAGIAVMTVAIANREMTMDVEPEPQPCGAVATNPAGWVCVSNVGHRGRHRFRKPPEVEQIDPPTGGMVN